MCDLATIHYVQSIEHSGWSFVYCVLSRRTARYNTSHEHIGEKGWQNHYAVI